MVRTICSINTVYGTNTAGGISTEYGTLLYSIVRNKAELPYICMYHTYMYVSLMFRISTYSRSIIYGISIEYGITPQMVSLISGITGGAFTILCSTERSLLWKD